MLDVNYADAIAAIKEAQALGLEITKFSELVKERQDNPELQEVTEYLEGLTTTGEQEITLPCYVSAGDSKEVLCGAARYNSGTHFLDSGGEAGRHHQQPAIDRAQDLCRFDQPAVGDEYVTATICTPLFLAAQADHLEEMQDEFDNWTEYADRSGFNLFDDGSGFMEAQGFTQQARDNTYNGESDLSQEYVWEVYTPEHSDCQDWIYADDAILVVYIHTGADVRGGYSPPVFLKMTSGEYTAPLDLCAEAYASEAWEINGEEIDTCSGEIGEEWRSGYRRNPIGGLEDDMETITEVHDDGAITIKLKTGQTAKVYAQASIDY
tara:strand:- start:8008 stop:8973 length:966 start_codon:yes stop_codon:yes gene_type:complete